MVRLLIATWFFLNSFYGLKVYFKIYMVILPLLVEFFVYLMKRYF